MRLAKLQLFALLFFLNLLRLNQILLIHTTVLQYFCIVWEPRLATSRPLFLHVSRICHKPVEALVIDYSPI